MVTIKRILTFIVLGCACSLMGSLTPESSKFSRDYVPQLIKIVSDMRNDLDTIKNQFSVVQALRSKVDDLLSANRTMSVKELNDQRRKMEGEIRAGLRKAQSNISLQAAQVAQLTATLDQINTEKDDMMHQKDYEIAMLTDKNNMLKKNIDDLTAEKQIVTEELTQEDIANQELVAELEEKIAGLRKDWQLIFNAFSDASGLSGKTIDLFEKLRYAKDIGLTGKTEVPSDLRGQTIDLSFLERKLTDLQSQVRKAKKNLEKSQDNISKQSKEIAQLTQSSK